MSDQQKSKKTSKIIYNVGLFFFIVMYLQQLAITITEPTIDNMLATALLTYLFAIPMQNLIKLNGGTVEFSKLASIFGKVIDIVPIAIILFVTFFIESTKEFTGVDIFNTRGNTVEQTIGIIIALGLIYYTIRFWMASIAIESYSYEALEFDVTSSSQYMLFFIVPLTIVGLFIGSDTAWTIFGFYFIYKIYSRFFKLPDVLRAVYVTKHNHVYDILNKEL